MYKARFRKTAPQCNPEYASIEIDAKDQKGAEAEAKALLKLLPDMHPGWSSYGEPEHWGKPAGIELLEVTSA